MRTVRADCFCLFCTQTCWLTGWTYQTWAPSLPYRVPWPVSKTTCWCICIWMVRVSQLKMWVNTYQQRGFSLWASQQRCSRRPTCRWLWCSCLERAAGEEICTTLWPDLQRDGPVWEGDKTLSWRYSPPHFSKEYERFIMFGSFTVSRL